MTKKTFTGDVKMHRISLPRAGRILASNHVWPMGMPNTDHGRIISLLARVAELLETLPRVHYQLKMIRAEMPKPKKPKKPKRKAKNGRDAK